MLEHALTTIVCKRIATALIEKQSWSVARIAQTLSAPPEYVQRVLSEKQSFQMSDVEKLAKACEVEPAELIFGSIRRTDLPVKNRGLYDLVSAEVNRFREFREVMGRKPVSRRRTGTKAKSVA
jgi:hypothetical protein